MPEGFSIETYNYPLPDERIARFPLEQRDGSKMLLWNNGAISHHVFQEAPNLIPPGSMLVFNDTRVIAARLHFKKSTGADIEVFLLHPELPSRDIATSMSVKGTTVWQCLVGNKKRWKEGALEKKVGAATLTVSYHNRDLDLIRLSWDTDESFAEVINRTGETPLPPYLKRHTQASDSQNYQTVYSNHDGAVAAPTAGLHFSSNILEALKKKDILMEYLTLHVSAGTFRPVEQEDFRNHPMHYEQVTVTTAAIEQLFQHSGKLIAVGTTSLRILESLYWYGVLLTNDPEADFIISQTLPYELASDMSFEKSLHTIHELLTIKKLSKLHGETGIFIYPGYRIRSAHGLFTNFHLPKSTLLLLVSTFTGNQWKAIYDSALVENYRFLSYGDSSLLLR